MRAAVIGAGDWGKNLVRVFCLLLGNENVRVCDPSEQCRNIMMRTHPGISVSPENDLDDVDAVVIAAPAVLHFELAKRALLDEKHVLVEKPLGMTSEEALELIEIAQSRRILMVDHLLEYHPAVVELKRLIQQGTMGQLFHITSQRLNLGVIRSEENALWSLAPHDISVMLFLLDEEPNEVIARGQAVLQEGIEDVTYLMLRFPSGTLGSIHTSWLDPVKTRRLTVVGEQCMAVFDDMAGNKLMLYAHTVEQKAGRFHTMRGDAEPLSIDSAEPLATMARAFLHSVRTGQPPRSDGRDGLRVVRVLEQAQRSMEKGRTL